MNAPLKNAFFADLPPLGMAEKQEIIDGMYKHFTLPAACEALHYDLRRVMHAKDNDPEFSQALEIVEVHLAEYGVEELKRRAIQGVEKYVVNQGRVVHMVDDQGRRKPLKEVTYSDTLLKMYLETQRRDKFGAKVEIQHNHQGHIALPVMSPEITQLMLAMQRGDEIELISDESMTENDKYEVVSEPIDAEFEDINVPDMTPKAENPAESDGFDIL